ncbi:PAS domain-containing sensor histidine kinase [Nocardioides psychrotolerans]|uniref:histidine kinase n=1 Tax=Nocardioides psychrotolerans TaxID=1005945 RepID=A0A1I3BRQ6_9ACTN|nr:PAS domain-containing sensor histidine kinase [Nocardioides psychrotolerans]SFH64766.1 Signal transduction histidine kinase [Nocardioides psychrotolerans]
MPSLPSPVSISPRTARRTARGRETFLAVLSSSPVPAVLVAGGHHGLTVLAANEAARRSLPCPGPLVGGDLGDVLGHDDLSALVDAVTEVVGGRLASWVHEAGGTGPLATARLTLSRLTTPGEQPLGVLQILHRPAERSDPHRADPTEHQVAQGLFDRVTHDVDRGDRFSRREWTCVRQDGERRAVTLTISALREPGGTTTGHLVLGEDVTERRRGDDLLARARGAEREAARRLAALERAKDDFLTTVGHELRTPLASILGFTELLRDQGPGGPASADLLERVLRNGERMLELVEGMAMLARLGSTPVQADAPDVDLRDVVRRAVAHVACAAQARGQRLEVELPGGPVVVAGHDADLTRAVGELLDNAVKFTPADGSITVSLAQEARECVLVVADTGDGIPADEQDHVFDRFARSARTVDQAVPGTGIGLAILREVVTIHGGSVAVTSGTSETSETSGARFTVRLPLREA